MESSGRIGVVNNLIKAIGRTMKYGKFDNPPCRGEGYSYN